MGLVLEGAYTLPNDNTLDSSNFNSNKRQNFNDWTNFKAFADNKLNVVLTMVSCFDRIENIVGNGENAGYQHFLLFPQCFQNFKQPGSLKVRIVW